MKSGIRVKNGGRREGEKKTESGTEKEGGRDEEPR